MNRLTRALATLMLTLIAGTVWADEPITLFNLSAAEVERVKADSCDAFSDKDDFPFVASDKVRTLGAATKPTWTSEKSCTRAYCLTTPDWRSSRPEGRSCFELMVKSKYANLCTRSYNPASCDQYTYVYQLTPADSVGEKPVPISGATNELQTARYRISLMKTGAIVVADIGLSYRKKPN
ncbi:hypothetical protein [Elstera sp.]|jgi:hypothetical protein|uniref:hypothetical protein n=1 Tax=Elstera sp. TaxID=1916664 RepID=UPI0037BEFE1E